MRFWATLILLLIWTFSATAQAQSWREVDPQRVIDDAREVLRAMTQDPDYEPLLADLQTARGVLIFPRVIRGGFFVGGSGGLGVFLAYDSERRDFSPVGFYSVGSVSFGLQFGGEWAEVVMVARTQRAVDSLFASTARLGGDASVAVGTIGAGRSSTVTTDFLSYARSRGAFIGLSVEGWVLRVRDDFNEAFYGQALRPVEIIQERRVDNPGTLGLREDLLGLRQRPAEGAMGGMRQEPPSPALPEPVPPAYVPPEPVPPGSGGLTIEELEVERI